MLTLAISMTGGLSRAGGQEASSAPAPTAAPATALPNSPTRLFAALAKDRRPQWRPYFRQMVPRAGTDRFKTALALGAVCADCFLAAEAHDAQQILNLLTDMASLEMSLSISRQAGGTRQKFTDLAEASDWAGVRVEIAALMDLHREALSAQQDELLAELERTGLWLRSFHIGARFSSNQKNPPAQPCIWSLAMLQDVQQRTAKATDTREAATLHTLNTGLVALQKTWAVEAPAADQLAATLKALDALMADLIGDDTGKESAASP
jgi:hypothetical protein